MEGKLALEGAGFPQGAQLGLWARTSVFLRVTSPCGWTGLLTAWPSQVSGVFCMAAVFSKGKKAEAPRDSLSLSLSLSFTYLKKKFFVFNVYLFLGQRETEHERGRGRERGRHRIGNRLQAPSHQPRARHGARTHGPQDRDPAEVGGSTDCATQAPLAS